MSKTSYVLLGSLLLFSSAYGEEKFISAADQTSHIDHHMHQQHTQIALPSSSYPFFGEVSYLCWKSYEEGLSYAYTGSGALTNVSVKNHNLQFDWNSGVRLGFGYLFPQNSWEVKGSWTYLESTAKGSKLYQSNNALDTTWLNAYSSSGSGLKAHLQTNLNILDGELARAFYSAPHISLKPHFGIRGLWISQKYRVINFLQNHSKPNLYSKTNSHSQGVGLRVGLDTDWEFCENWSIYGNVGGALVSSFVRLKNSTFSIIANDENALESVSQKDQLKAFIAPNIDIAVGFAWKYAFKDIVTLSIKAGWEFNDFVNQNQLTSFAAGVTSFAEDLTYQGLTLSARLDF